MKRACLAVMFVAASSGVANAGYLGLGIGTGPAMDSDAMEFESVGRSGRVIAGMRWGQLSVEGAIGGFDAVGAMRSRNNVDDVYQASAAAKLSLPLGSGFEAFGKGGLQRTWLRLQNSDETFNVSGDGYLLGAGFEYKLNLGVAGGSLWVDYQYTTASLTGDRQSFDLSSRMWTLGLSVGI